MKVVFDGQIFSAQAVGGISRYFVSLAAELARAGEVQPFVVAPLHLNEYLDELPRHLKLARRVRVRPRLAQLMSLATLPVVLAAQRAARPQIVHRTYYYPQPSAPRPARVIVTVYDMIHDLRPDDFADGGALVRWKRRAVERSDHVICISESTRRDLIACYGTAPEKVSVTHLAASPLELEPAALDGSSFRRQALGADVPYLLYVGARAGYKNFRGLLRAYAGSRQLRRSFHLLCFGGGAFTAGEKSAIAADGLDGTVHWMGGGDRTLAACYRHAALFVYPSLYEGFGIPPLEAMSLDCPVACSNTSSLPEVVGDAAATFDPASDESIRIALERTLASPAMLERLVDRGRERLAAFSWRKCAHETANVYRRVAAS